MFSIRYTFLTFIFIIQLFFYNNWMNGNWIIILISLIPIFTSMKMVFKKNYKNNIKNSLFLSISVIFGIYILLYGVHNIGSEKASLGLWMYLFALCVMIWEMLSSWSEIDTSLNSKLNFVINLVVPVLFGISLLFLWQVLTVGLKIPHILLPSPLKIGIAFSNSIPMLWEDFQQTFLKAVLSGYFMGCFSGFIIAIMVDRIPFLQKGLLPLGNLISALPIIGIAPIMVMWFGFDWQSKAAVVVIMTFFPMLVNTITGLSVTGQIEKDLLHSYAANYWQNLILLRIPVSLPFVFNALKINSTLALIGAIVAEFFGTPIVGMGFRISAEIGRLNVDIVWATILVAALSGSMFYALIAICERSLTSWHPSIRKIKHVLCLCFNV